LKSIKDAGVNRLSIGVQSFSDDDLKFMNRVHDARMALDSVKAARDRGSPTSASILFMELPLFPMNNGFKTCKQLLLLMFLTFRVIR